MNIFAKRPAAGAPAPIGAPVPPAFPSGHMKADPRHVAAMQQHAQLADTLAHVRAQRREKDLIRLSLKPVPAPTAADHLADALQFAAGGELVSRQPKELAELRVEDQALAQQEAALLDAMAVGPVVQVERLLNREFAAGLAHEHAEIQREYAKTLRRLGELELRERALSMRGAVLGYDDVQLRGRIRWDHLGEIDDPNSALSIRLRELGA